MWKITDALPEDNKTLTQIAFAAKRHWNYPEEWIQAWADGLTVTAEDIEKDKVLKAVNPEGKILGFCWLKHYLALDEVEIEGFWVDPESIGQGVGNGLFKEIDKFARFKKAKSIKAVADLNAVGFYKKLGFEDTGKYEESYPPGRRLPIFIYRYI